MQHMSRVVISLIVLLVPLCAQEKVDLEALYRIKAEALQRSKVMDHLLYLTDVNGPRLTGSPGYQKAAEWCVKQLKDWGMDNARLEKWGPFGRGWQNERLSVNLIEPSYTPLIAIPMAWTNSTSGVVTDQPVLAVLRTDEDLAKWKGKLKGKIVMPEAARDLAVHEKAELRRLSEQDLADLAMAPTPGASPFGMRNVAPTPGSPQQNFMQIMAFRRKLAAYYR